MWLLGAGCFEEGNDWWWLDGAVAVVLASDELKVCGVEVMLGSRAWRPEESLFDDDDEGGMDCDCQGVKNQELDIDPAQQVRTARQQTGAGNGNDRSSSKGGRLLLGGQTQHNQPGNPPDVTPATPGGKQTTKEPQFVCKGNQVLL